MIRLATYGEEEFLIGIPGSNERASWGLRSKRLRARPSESSSFDSGNRSLGARNFLAPRDCPGDPDALSEMPIFSSTKPKRGAPQPDCESTSSKRL